MDFSFVVSQADELRQQVNGDTVSYVVNRNINYTNVCYFKCQFCAFSKGKLSENLRGRPYDITAEDIAGRCIEAWQRGATEVCMQGGIHPDYTGQTYLDIVHTVRSVAPHLHIHAFSPLEVWQGAATLGVSVPTFLRQLRMAGLNTLPGTAAEILHDEVRASLCPDKLNTAQWLEVMAAAHAEGLRTTATIMYGHIDRPRHWASHLLQIRGLQQLTGGFTEFVPLPFVHMEAPMYLKGKARRGPSFREAILMHAVARLVLHGLIDNIQASWVKMGPEGVAACLQAGVNDLGGSLMNESITRAAGSGHGQEWAPAQMEAQIRAAGRRPRMRTTLYADAAPERRMAAFDAAVLVEVYGASAGKQQRSKRLAPPVEVQAAPEVFPLNWVQQSRDAAVYESVVLMAACN
jgi:FO synthase